MPPVRPYFISLTVLLGACSLPSSCGVPCCVPGACDDEPGGGGTSGAGGSSGGPAEDPIEVAHDPARPAARSFVAKLAPGQACPTLPVPWVLQSAPPTPSAQLGKLMGQYCAYRVESGAATPSLPTLDPAVFVRAAADPVVVLPQAGGQHYQQMRESLGVKFEPGAANVPPASRPTVAIVDTTDRAPAWAAGTPRERHGWVMGGIVSAVRCPGETPCDAAQQLYAQAFPTSLTQSPSDTEARGSVWSLNEAVLDALAQWRDRGGDTPLVLNLSLGWTPRPEDLEFLGGSAADLLSGNDGRPELTPAEEALFLTLSTASCLGVLTFAATGNTRGGACEETGMMAPATWENVTPPNHAQCVALLDEADRARLGDAGSYVPAKLVYGVGGVDGHGRPIVNARPDSAPPRVLHAAHASVPMGGGTYTATWTGTSVATAAMSAIAAQYWGLHPSLSADAVVTDLMAHKDDLPAGCTKNSPGTIPRLRPDLAMGPLYAARIPPGALASLTPSAPSKPASVALAHAASRDATCTDRTITTYSYAGAQGPAGPGWPELSPQPNTPMCPTCTLTMSGTSDAEVELDIDDDLVEKVDGTTAVLELHMANGTITVVDLDLTQHCPPATPAGQTAPNPGALDLRQCSAASLGVYVDPTASSDPSRTLSTYVTSTGVNSAWLSFHVVTDPNGGTQLFGNELDVDVL